MLKFREDFGKQRFVGFSWSRSLDIFEFWGLLLKARFSGGGFMLPVVFLTLVSVLWGSV